ncbi:DUF4252 domain-containing protein [Planktosalinus lacus]|uniref:DUF4252 domain-containing protein n=1 Tax=Planktosalinus lacus TaxID=1526573 RepID=A0A8J2YAY6_9FLAO|nr:DUF4252 domain-containing protein [Planktosalinus lacus]GGD99340.1 hypothetical protein GCM10011312_23560 [Planktosalinus lacus]
MKKIIAILAVTLITQAIYSQAIFDKFENQNDVSSLVVTKSMFKLMSKIDLSSDDPEAKNYLKMVENLDDIKIFTTGNNDKASDMKRTVENYLKSTTSLSELMRVNDDGQNIRFYVKEGKNDNYVSELFMFLEDPTSSDSKAVIMSITGNIDLRQISQLTSDLKVPGSEQLKNIDQKKSNK